MVSRESNFRELLAEADTHFLAQRYAEAEPWIRKALAAGESEWGPGSMHLLRAMRMLATSLDRRDQAGGDEVIELREQILRICETAHGAKSLEVAEELMNVARSLISQKKLAEAVMHQRRSVEIFEAHADELSRDYSRARLAQTYFELGQNDDAIKYYALAAEGHDLRNEHPLRVIAHHGLGDALLSADRFDEARAHLEVALELASTLTPRSESSPLVATIKESLAKTLH